MHASTITGEKMNLQLRMQIFTITLNHLTAVEKKFESGLVDVTDYSLAKTTLFKAETETLRTKLAAAYTGN